VAPDPQNADARYFRHLRARSERRSKEGEGEDRDDYPRHGPRTDAGMLRREAGRGQPTAPARLGFVKIGFRQD
jgi:hypothetical protein